MRNFRPLSAALRIVFALFTIAVAVLAFATFDGRAIPAFNAGLERVFKAEPVAVRTVTPGTAIPKQGYCALRQSALVQPLDTNYWTSWGGDLNNRRSQPANLAGLRKDQVGGLKLKWVFGIPGPTEMSAQPTVAAGRLFLGSGAGKIYSIDAESGCIYWIFDAGIRVRTAITIGALGDRQVAYFADAGGPDRNGGIGATGTHAYAVDVATGRLIWKTTVDDFPSSRVSGTPALASGKLFVPITAGEDALAGNPDFECCHFQGSLAALDAVTGRPIWKSSTITQPSRPVRKNSKGVQQWGPSGAGIWSAPTVDLVKRAIYVGTGDSHSDPPATTSDAILAFDMDTGAMLWSRQMTAGDAWNIACVKGDPTNCPEAHGADLDFATPPVLVDLPNGRRALIAGQKSGIVYSLDPDNHGREMWRRRIGRGGLAGGIVAGASTDERNVYIALSDVADPFSQPPDEKDPWQRRLPDEFVWLWNQAIFHLRSSAGGGGTFALRLESGEEVWHSPPQCIGSEFCRPGQLGAVSGIPGVVFSGTLDGHIRAYNTDDGSVRWLAATTQSYAAINGLTAHGGIISNSGPVIAGGLLYLNTGNSVPGDPIGNALLAFSVEGK